MIRTPRMPSVTGSKAARAASGTMPYPPPTSGSRRKPPPRCDDSRGSFASRTTKSICSRHRSPCVSIPRSARLSGICKAAASGRFSLRRWRRGSSAKTKIRCRWRPGWSLDTWCFVRAGESNTGEAEPLVGDPILPRWLSGEAIPDAALGGILRTRFPARRWSTGRTSPWRHSSGRRFPVASRCAS